MTEKYNKLVRDKIPDIIRQNGDLPKTETLDDKRYFDALNQKLKEELNEYLEDFNIGELADIVEVIHAIVEHKGVSLNYFDDIRLKKHDECGGFKNKVFLIEVERKYIE